MVAGNGSGALAWTVLEKRTIADCRVFTLTERVSESPEGRQARFSVLESRDWATVVPLLRRPDGDYFLMVRQYRHGLGEVCVEFPGGIVDPGETPLEAAGRELLEETGFHAGRMRLAGSLSPNPAILANHFHVFLADMLEGGGDQDLDEDEILDAFLVPVAEVRKSMGKPPYSHSLMVTALFLAQRLMDADQG